MKKGAFARRIVLFCIVFSVLYIAIVLIIFCITGEEPETLTVCVFTYLIAELLSLIMKRIKCGSSAQYDKDRDVENDLNGREWSE